MLHGLLKKKSHVKTTKDIAKFLCANLHIEKKLCKQR